jgi:hypothetical protein
MKRETVFRVGPGPETLTLELEWSRPKNSVVGAGRGRSWPALISEEILNGLNHVHTE